MISVAGWLLSLYTGFLAIQEGLDFDTGKTIATVVIGWIVASTVNVVIGMVGAGALTDMFSG